jgi:membrane-associated phospholipid phosphatase
MVAFLVARPTRAVASNPVDWTPWVLETADQFRLDAPPADGSRQTRREIRRLLSLQEERTRAIRRQVRFWNKGPATARWTEVMLDMIVRHRPRVAPAARVLALYHTGLFDALVAAYDSRQAYGRTPPHKLDRRIDPLLRARGTSYPPVQAVIAGAAERLLTHFFPDESPETFVDLARKATRSRLWAGVNYPSDVRAGRRLGHDVADAVIAYGETDGHTSTGFVHQCPNGQTYDATTFCGDEQYWEPTPPIFDVPVGGPVGKWTPWVVDPVDARVGSGIPGPFPYGSAEFMAELQEVMDIDANLTDEQASIATFWDDGPGSFTPPGHWNDIVLDLVRNFNVGTKQTARIFAYLNVAEYDSAIAYFEAKYFWWSIRPITVVRRLCDDPVRLCTKAELEADPSLATEPDWESYLITPNFPSYPSGHSTFSGAAGAVLEHFFPEASGLLNQRADEAALSRLLAGIHFRSDNDDGLTLGRYIAEQIIARALTDGSGL